MTKKTRVVIAAGGTGGHIFPALALAQKLQHHSQLDVIFMGGKLHANALFKTQNQPFYSVCCAPFATKHPLKLIKNLALIFKGWWQSRQILKKIQPDLIIGFGSYYTFPILSAAWSLKKRFVLHEANSIPGKVNRIFAKKALITGILFPLAAQKLKGVTVEVGMPLRENFEKDKYSKSEAKIYYGFNPQKKVLLIFGGSQGAEKVNNKVLECAAEFGQEFQILHFIGKKADLQAIEGIYQQSNVKAIVKPFEDHMQMALAAADIAITRSGAGTIAEFIEFEIPAILIPYPFAAEQHQDFNADFYVKVLKSGIKILEKDLTKENLLKALNQLPDLPTQLNQYKKARSTLNLETLILHHLKG